VLLVRDVAVLEADAAINGTSTRRPVRATPGEKHLVDDAVGPNRAAHGDKLGVLGIVADEVVFLEALELIVTDAAGHGRDVIALRLDSGSGARVRSGYTKKGRTTLVPIPGLSSVAVWIRPVSRRPRVWDDPC